MDVSNVRCDRPVAKNRGGYGFMGIRGWELLDVVYSLDFK